MFTYIQIIALKYPNVKCSSSGNGSIYESLVWEDGDPIPNQNELDETILTETRARMWELIKSKRDSIKYAGVKVGNYWFYSDDSSRIQHLSLVVLGQNMPSGIMWKTMSGEFVEMTPTLAVQIFGAFVAKEQEIYFIGEAHKAAMLQSTNPASYDYSTGWPQVYSDTL